MSMHPDAATSPEIVKVFRDIVKLALHPETGPSPRRLVDAVMGICELAGYDSVDREIGFGLLADEPKLNLEYEQLYQAWLTGPGPR